MAYKKLERTPENEKLLLQMYRLNYSFEDIATAFGVHVEALRRFVGKKDNADLKEKCEREKILANVAVRQSLLFKAVGSPGKKGKPTVVDQAGNVIEKGVPDQAATPGETDAMKTWLFNREPQDWKNIKQTQLTGPNGGPLQLQDVSSRSDRELEEMILEAVKEGLIDMAKLKLDRPNDKNKVTIPASAVTETASPQT